MDKTYWIWYPGDFELYYGMKQNFSRVERGYGWPAFWKSEGFRNRVAFQREYDLKEETSFQVFSQSVGYVLAGERKYAFGQTITCPPGKIRISVHCGCVEAFPSIYIAGDIIRSDAGWQVEDYEHPLRKVGFSKYFTKQEQDPHIWEYSEREYIPVRKTEINGGVLFEFETELTAVLQVSFPTGYRPVRVCCGESLEEALDREHCYYSWAPDRGTGKCPCCAVRFAYIPDCSAQEIELVAHYQYVDMPVKASFSSGDALLNRIWDVSVHTFRLCSGIFFLDGIKRDKWIWSGDAYQSLFVNPYLLADKEVEQRTLRALRGNDPMTTHINTIVDYSLLWLLGVWKNYQSYKDVEFVRELYPKMKSLMAFCDGQTQEQGFLTGREKDWIYIDWADFDKEGPLCAEQMLFARCWEVLGEAAELLGEESSSYHARSRQLSEKIQEYYWDEDQGAYIDSFSSGRRNVTRHANIFAYLFDIAGKEKKKQIIERVIRNEMIPAITTPYFKFFELEVLCQAGFVGDMVQLLRDYWGGMLERGAVTFWEEFNPKQPEDDQYDMYGDRFGKSLCHIWAASPVYFLAKYVAGLEILAPGGEKFRVEPHTELIPRLDCTLPLGEGSVHITWDENSVRVETDRKGGVLRLDGSETEICGTVHIERKK